MDRKIRVFVYETTSADPLCVDAALASQGRSMRDAMVADLAQLDEVAVSCAVRVPRDPSLPASVQPHCRVAGESPCDFLGRQAAAHDLVWVVAPETGAMLSSLRAAVPDRQWLGCSAQAIDIAGSKRATAALLRQAGIAATEPIDAEMPIAADTVPGDGSAGSGAAGGVGSGARPGVGSGAWVVKPDDGCGAAAARRHPDFALALDDFLGRRRRREPAVLEPWIEGEALSMTLLCSAQDVELLSVNRQDIAVDERGSLSFGGVAIGPVTGERGVELAALARRIGDALPGLGGIVGVDLTWHPVRGPVVIEVNPRVTCAYAGLSARLGRNLAAEMLAQHRRARHGAAAIGTAPAR